MQFWELPSLSHHAGQKLAWQEEAKNLTSFLCRTASTPHVFRTDSLQGLRTKSSPFSTKSREVLLHQAFEEMSKSFHLPQMNCRLLISYVRTVPGFQIHLLFAGGSHFCLTARLRQGLVFHLWLCSTTTIPSEIFQANIWLQNQFRKTGGVQVCYQVGWLREYMCELGCISALCWYAISIILKLKAV